MNRRELLLGGLGCAAALSGAPRSNAQEKIQSFADTIALIASDSQAIDAARRYSDYAPEDTQASCIIVNVGGKSECVVSAARRPPDLKPSTLRISNRAISLIVACEVSSQAHYTAALEHPTWPGLQSGITIGIGYDLGQVTEDQFVDEWRKYVHPFVIDTLSPVTRFHGTDARDRLSSVQMVGVKWADAYKQFSETSLPLFIAETEKFCPHVADLPEDSRGALASLIYNRGSAKYLKNDPNDSRKEMRTIADLMAQQKYAEIPAQFESMKRIWKDRPEARGLLLRRTAEAQLFQLGLDA
jgi:GH24 family phage-related lysozyme (muramidase)